MINHKKIILLGAPGSGKGTLSQLLIDQGFMHISTGDLFRKKLQENNDESQQIQLLLNRGELIPDEVTNKLAKDEILKCIKVKSFVLDGYPRTIEQAKYLDTVCKIDRVIYLYVEEDILYKRITGRLTCSKCNHIYNTYFKPPHEQGVCDVCKIPLTKRRDDNETSFKFRMSEFVDKTKNLINYYENTNKLVKINGNQEMQKVLEEVNRIING